MTETTPEPTDDAPAAPDTAEPTEEGREGGNREAARYRTQLRAAEAERDALAARVATLHRSTVERLAGEHLAVPADLFAVGGAELADLLDQGGDVDPQRVAALVADLLDARPGLARDAGPRRLDLGQGVRVTTSTGGASWQKLLRARP